MSDSIRARRFGETGERIFERWVLERNGCIITTSRSQEGGGAAMVDTLTKRWIRQDLLISLEKKAFFVDVKTKQHACGNRTFGITVTGCALRNYEHYEHIQAETGIRGALAFIQYEERVLLMGYLDEIWPGSHKRTDHTVDYPTIYFDVANFDRYRLKDEDWALLSRSAATEVRRREWEDHQRIAKEVASEWKQRSMNFGAGERYR